MLNELEELQSSNEELWSMPEVSFTIRTKEESPTEIVKRKYTFSHAPEWDKWVFSEYEERRTDNEKMRTSRNWRRTRHIEWHEGKSMPDVPGEVSEKLEELLDLDEVTFQK